MTCLQEECRGWDVNEIVFGPAMWPTYHSLMRADFTLFDEYKYQHAGKHGCCLAVCIVHFKHPLPWSDPETFSVPELGQAGWPWTLPASDGVCAFLHGVCCTACQRAGRCSYWLLEQCAPKHPAQAKGHPVLAPLGILWSTKLPLQHSVFLGLIRAARGLCSKRNCSAAPQSSKAPDWCAGAAPLDCPITAFYGTKDKRITKGMMEGWQRFTTGSHELLEIAGHHLWPLDKAAKHRWLGLIFERLTWLESPSLRFA